MNPYTDVKEKMHLSMISESLEGRKRVALVYKKMWGKVKKGFKILKLFAQSLSMFSIRA